MLSDSSGSHCGQRSIEPQTPSSPSVSTGYGAGRSLDLQRGGLFSRAGRTCAIFPDNIVIIPSDLRPQGARAVRSSEPKRPKASAENRIFPVSSYAVTSGPVYTIGASRKRSRCEGQRRSCVAPSPSPYGSSDNAPVRKELLSIRVIMFRVSHDLHLRVTLALSAMGCRNDPARCV